MQLYARPSLFVVWLLASLSGCVSQGPRAVPSDYFDYNNALAQSLQEQMLLNVVRLRYFETPMFLAVGSILTQYTWQGTVGVAGQQGFDLSDGVRASTFVGGSAAAAYAERPTVTFVPIEGDDFSRRLMTPIPLDVVFAIGEAGYPADILFRVGIARVNDVENMAGGIPPPGLIDPAQQAQREAERQAQFQALVDVVLRLQFLGAIEVQTVPTPDGRERLLVIAEQPSAEAAPLVRELKSRLALEPSRNVFRITDRKVGRDPDEITVKTRSLLQIMGFLSLGVAVPPEQRPQAGLADGGSPAPGGVPFRVRSGRERPTGAFIATRYNDHWFAIANDDIESKRSFNHLIYLFRLLAPERAPTAPLLSLPTGP